MLGTNDELENEEKYEGYKHLEQIYKPEKLYDINISNNQLSCKYQSFNDRLDKMVRTYEVTITREMSMKDLYENPSLAVFRLDKPNVRRKYFSNYKFNDDEMNELCGRARGVWVWGNMKWASNRFPTDMILKSKLFQDCPEINEIDGLFLERETKLNYGYTINNSVLKKINDEGYKKKIHHLTSFNPETISRKGVYHDKESVEIGRSYWSFEKTAPFIKKLGYFKEDFGLKSDFFDQDNMQKHNIVVESYKKGISLLQNHCRDVPVSDSIEVIMSKLSGNPWNILSDVSLSGLGGEFDKKLYEKKFKISCCFEIKIILVDNTD